MVQLQQVPVDKINSTGSFGSRETGGLSTDHSDIDIIEKDSNIIMRSQAALTADQPSLNPNP